MADDDSARMQQFWDARARENAAWFVDTTLHYDDPDMAQFFATGRRIVEEAYVDAPAQPAQRAVALDIGCGLGRISVALAEHFDRVIGIDISAEMLERARVEVTDERVEFVLGDGESLRPIEDASVDFVTSFTVLQHLPTRELVLHYFAEAARVLRPGGVLAMQWNNLPHPRLWRAQTAWWRLRQRIGIGDEHEKRNQREFAGTRVPWAPIAATLERNGMEVCGRKGDDTLFAWVWARVGMPS